MRPQWAQQKPCHATPGPEAWLFMRCQRHVSQTPRPEYACTLAPPRDRAHLKTGREIWDQTRGRLDAFVSGAGTGGTIAGVSHSLKRLRPSVRVFLVDPPGSGLFNKVWRACGGVCGVSIECELAQWGSRDCVRCR